MVSSEERGEVLFAVGSIHTAGGRLCLPPLCLPLLVLSVGVVTSRTCCCMLLAAGAARGCCGCSRRSKRRLSGRVEGRCSRLIEPVYAHLLSTSSPSPPSSTLALLLLSYDVLERLHLKAYRVASSGGRHGSGRGRGGGRSRRQRGGDDDGKGRGWGWIGCVGGRVVGSEGGGGSDERDGRGRASGARCVALSEAAAASSGATSPASSAGHAGDRR